MIKEIPISTWRMSYKKRELLTLGEYLGSLMVFLGGVRFAHLFSFSALCLRSVPCPMLPLPFVIAPLGFL